MEGAPGMAAVNVRSDPGTVATHLLAPNGPELVELVMRSVRDAVEEALSPGEFPPGMCSRIVVEVRA